MDFTYLGTSPTSYYLSAVGASTSSVNTIKPSANPTVGVNDLGYPLSSSLVNYLRYQLTQSRRKYFIFHEIYRRDTWSRAAIDYICRRLTRDDNRLLDKADPLNPDIYDLKKFLEDCNPDSDFTDLYRGIVQDLLEYNQSYLFIEFDRSHNPVNLWPMDSRITFPLIDFSGTIVAHAQVYNGMAEIYDPSEVIFFNQRNNGSDPKGYPAMETLVESVAMEIQANKFNAALFENNLNIGAIFSIPDADDMDIEANKRILTDQYATPANAYRPMILKGDAKLIRDGSLMVKDINFEMLIGLARHRVCAVFGVPESLLGIPQNTNRSTGQVHERITYVNTIRPIRRFINRQFTRQFIRKIWGSYSIVLDEPLNSMLPTQEEIETISKIAENGINFNDLQEMYGFPRLPNGDYFVMKIPGMGGYQRIDLTAMPGLGDPHFDFVAYQKEHEADLDQQNSYTMQGMQTPSGMFPEYVQPASQNLIQNETIAARIIDLSRSIGTASTPDLVYRRIPSAPGSRGAATLYTTKNGTSRYGTPPKSKSAALDSKDGTPNENTLVNPRDANKPKRLSDKELQQMSAAHAQVNGIFRQSQDQNWTNEQFFTNMESAGWQSAQDTRSEFQDVRDARSESRRLGELNLDRAYTIIGSEGQYYVMENSLSAFGDNSTPNSNSGSNSQTGGDIGNTGKQHSAGYQPDSFSSTLKVKRSMGEGSLSDWAESLEGFINGF